MERRYTRATRKETAVEPHLQALFRSAGDQVRNCRQAMGLTQDDLAERVGTVRAHISVLENGSKMPSLSFLARVAWQLGVRVTITLSTAPPDHQRKRPAPLMER